MTSVTVAAVAAPAFLTRPDLASRALFSSVVAANDELFAQRENLIRPEAPIFHPEEFGNKGKSYDGWETRRRREPGSDWAVVRLGIPGVVHGVVIDTSWFKGNYPPFASVEGAHVDGYPGPDALTTAQWYPLVTKSAIAGDTRNHFQIDDPRRFTHIRLTIYPDGGVARFRVHGEPVPDPVLLEGTQDLAGLENGGRIVACSNQFYSSPSNLLRPDRARIMGEGWENARRRDDGNDFVVVQLGARGRIRKIELDTSYFIGNSAGWARVTAVDATSPGALAQPDSWIEIIAKTRLQPDTRHFFPVQPTPPMTHVRLDVYPDGGLARLRVNGEIDPETMATLRERWSRLKPQRRS